MKSFGTDEVSLIVDAQRRGNKYVNDKLLPIKDAVMALCVDVEGVKLSEELEVVLGKSIALAYFNGYMDAKTDRRLYRKKRRGRI